MSEKYKIAIFTAVVTLISSGSGYYFSSMQYANDMAFRQKAFMVEKKYEIYTTYMKSVNQSWAQYQISGVVDGELRQKGIDAFDEIRVISKPAVQEKADKLNFYFSKLYPPFKITEKETLAFNSAFNAFKKIANEQFIF